jgi:hypothetical protein
MKNEKYNTVTTKYLIGHFCPVAERVVGVVVVALPHAQPTNKPVFTWRAQF